MGANPAQDAMDRAQFAAQWLGIVTTANLCLVLLHLFLPKLPQRLLQVPGHQHWLACDATRKELLSRIRFALEASLLGLNVFLLAVYQLIYESAVPRPLLYFSPEVLVWLFMVLPVTMALAAAGLTIQGLARDAKNATAAPTTTTDK
jgi:hypothetical protein